MVGNLTVGTKTYAQVEPEVYMRLEKLADLRGRLLGLVGADAEAFGPLAAAYRMPKDTPEQLAAKQAAIQDALIGATEVPLDIMRTAAACVEHADFLARNGSRMARSDAGVSVAFARAAVDGASLNVYINAASIGRRRTRRTLPRRGGSARRADARALRCGVRIREGCGLVNGLQADR